MRKILPLAVFLLTIALNFSGCSADTAPSGKQAATSTQRYTVTGVVISVDREAKEAIIEHEKIDDLMDAMRMGFSVPDPADLEKLQSGKKLKATLVVENNMMWIEGVEVLGDAPASASAEPQEAGGNAH